MKLDALAAATAALTLVLAPACSSPGGGGGGFYPGLPPDATTPGTTNDTSQPAPDATTETGGPFVLPDTSDGCGGATLRCTNSSLESCSDGVWTQLVDCAAAGQVCQGGICVPADCVPWCDDWWECGSDGCGGSCGSCESGMACDQGEKICLSDCETQCDVRECGDDGCGGSCGSCQSPLTCDADFSCVGLQECVEAPSCQCMLDDCLPDVASIGSVYCSMLSDTCLAAVADDYVFNGCSEVDCGGEPYPGQIVAMCNEPDCASTIETLEPLLGTSELCAVCASTP